MTFRALPPARSVLPRVGDRRCRGELRSSPAANSLRRDRRAARPRTDRRRAGGGRNPLRRRFRAVAGGPRALELRHTLGGRGDRPAGCGRRRQVDWRPATQAGARARHPPRRRGHPPSAELRSLIDDRTAAVLNYLAAAALLVIIVLMVVKPGSPRGRQKTISPQVRRLTRRRSGTHKPRFWNVEPPPPARLTLAGAAISCGKAPENRLIRTASVLPSTRPRWRR